MNFFAAQDQARKNTTRLVVLFLLAVFSLIFMTNIVVLVAMSFLNPDYLLADDFLSQFDWYMFGLISVGISAVVLIGTVYKMLQLSHGGGAVAEMLGGKLISPDTDNYDEKKLVNVVTEMSIASGTPVPPVYVMENESGINAFAAGYYQRDAVVAVTRGTIELLERDELQGVIAHEFSHIFNGDMRLNIRLIGLLHGIMVIGIIGYLILRTAPRSRNSKGGGAAPVAILGLGLMIVGYSGTFFGNLIKSAVSRQREFLADASAVQFTRNPDGIANALKKIGGSVHGSMIQSPDADEISHAWFSEGVSHFLNFMMATHPHLEKRIRTIEPGWDGNFITPEKNSTQAKSEERENIPAFNKQTLFSIATVLAAQETIEQIGHPGEQHLGFAHQMLTILPNELIDAANNTYSARAVIYFLLLSNDASIEKSQHSYLMQHADDGIAAVTLRLSSFKLQMRDEYRLSLIYIALASLQQLTSDQYKIFINNIDALIHADNKVELFEWAIQKIIKHYLTPGFEKQNTTSAKYRECKILSEECILLLSVLWHAGHNQEQQKAEFDAALASIGIKGILLGKNDINLNKFNNALDKLNRLYPLQKPALLKACMTMIAADTRVTVIESELFRAIAAVLDCPTPPLLATSRP